MTYLLTPCLAAKSQFFGKAVPLALAEEPQIGSVQAGLATAVQHQEHRTQQRLANPGPAQNVAMMLLRVFVLRRHS